MQKLFGTDGVRGTSSHFPMTAEMVLRIGSAVGRFFRRQDGGVHRVVIGKDTRLSGYMFESALTAGLTSTGMNVLLLGPVPTPAVGLMTRSMRADLGIMISASHNPAEDNGIKFFGPDGFKLSDDTETQIEALIDSGVEPEQHFNLGRAKRIDDARFRYGERIKSSLPRDLRLDGLKVVIDCANGAAHRAAPEILWELGADVIRVGTKPNGKNINESCGSTDTKRAAETVISCGADVGICLDGDADRVVVLSESGEAADGDQLMALLAWRWAKEGRLLAKTLVATIMSNLGLEHFLQSKELHLERTAVGDRYVVERMRAGGFNLGGEQSGHIVMTDYATTGDGLMAGLHFLAEMVRTDTPASTLSRVFTPVPQVIENIRYKAGDAPLESNAVKSAVAEAEAMLADRGRLVVRESGTQPLIRVMVECSDTQILENSLQILVESIPSEDVPKNH
ncbi:MAG: phosphoglucosamine mutase [Aestuariivita sp.]|nr:phosphoglucosamine mutase [Aestuariivita sp.]MCY4201762.1 phosphoglucosamine mutase [Aestuariivita sp.]MCY4289414.1 phosphoglucosamine mutase [Aestuariivita sp.]MCY4346639.1 phosphoglucosamine mutase [Aestuariivita sp.]